MLREGGQEILKTFYLCTMISHMHSIAFYTNADQRTKYYFLMATLAMDSPMIGGFLPV